MGRRYLADPALATHDPLTHEPARASALDRNRYVTSPAVPPGYADFAPGGAKHVPPPPLGHHALTPRFQDAERLAGGRPAGASREEIAPKTAHWAKETSYEIYADSETLDGSLSAAAESRRRSRETTETSRRFAAPPRDHEPRVALPRRHPSDASVVIKHRDGAFPGAYETASDDVGKHVRDGTRAPSPRRPFPPPKSVVRLGADGPPVNSLVSTTHTEHYARCSESSTTDCASISGAGGTSTRVSRYDVITGAPRFGTARGAAGYEHHGASSSCFFRDASDLFPYAFSGTRAENGDPLLNMRPSRLPGSDPAAYDIVTGAARASAPCAFEQPGAARKNPGLAAMGTGSRRGFVELGNGHPSARAGSLGRRVDTTPW